MATSAPFCAACGATAGAPGLSGSAGTPMAQLSTPPMYQMAPRTSGMAIAGFVLSFFCGLLGLIFSVIGYNECRAAKRLVDVNGLPVQQVGGEGLALAGIIVSSLSMVLGIALVLGRH